MKQHLNLHVISLLPQCMVTALDLCQNEIQALKSSPVERSEHDKNPLQHYQTW